MRVVDLTGKILPSGIKVLYRAEAKRNGGIEWACLCHCGNEFKNSNDHLTRKKNPVKSCGCLLKRCGPRHSQWKGAGKISGLPIEISNTSAYSTASIDRIDSSQGYVPGNIQWVHKVINFMKRTYTQKYFIEMCRRVAANSGVKNEI